MDQPVKLHGGKLIWVGEHWINAIRPEGAQPPSGSPEELARRLFAHPERLNPLPVPDPALRQKTMPLVGRLLGPHRDAALEDKLGDLGTPTLVLFGLGVVPALISTVIFALPAPIRLTQLGIASVPRSLREAGKAFGAGP